MRDARDPGRSESVKDEAETTSDSSAGGPSRGTVERHTPPALTVLLALVLIVAADAFRLGFFADDFHFLDVARRIPILQALSGQYGVWPWFRPLSRELYFKVVVLSGPAALAVAHTLSLACLLGCAWLLWRVGARLFGAPAAAAGSALFVSYQFTKFLAAWPSGFQDLLALLLTLCALDAHRSGRHGQAILWAALAPFAKETGFLAFPLLAVWAFLVEARPPARGWATLVATTLSGTLLLHLAVRLTWHVGPVIPRSEIHTGRIMPILGQVLEGFAGGRVTWSAWPLALAVLAGGGLALMLHALERAGPSERGNPSGPSRARAATFVAIAAALGLTPLVAGHLLKLTIAHAYHAFPAVPWIALAVARLATTLPSPARRVVLPALVAWNVWTLGFQTPDLDRADRWRFRRWDWSEAVRLTAVSRRLGADLRLILAQRPESLVVLYEGIPRGSFFQSEDGPATREALRDPTVRAYWANDPGPDLRGDRLAILTFDADRFHLSREHWTA